MTLNTEFLKSWTASCTHIHCLGNIVVCLCVFFSEQFSFFCCFQGRLQWKNCYQKVMQKAVTVVELVKVRY